MLRRHAMRPLRSLRLTLIAREPRTPYSGMLPGLIRGDYSDDEAHIDCAPLAAAAGARLILATGEAIDLAGQHVHLGDRPPVAYDLLSVDVGGMPATPRDAGGILVKPIGRFLAQLAAIEAKLPRDATIAVIGAGAGGTELALALAARRHARIVLIARDGGPLADAPPRARAIVEHALVSAGVAVRHGTAIGHADDAVRLADGTAIHAQAAIWATGVIASPFLAASGLACDDAGCIRVDTTLRSISHPSVFAAGDCASIEGLRRPKAGVWAVRAGRKLDANLRRASTGRSLRAWRPQASALVILGLGGGRAVAWRGDRVLATGWLAARLKDRIDRRWMRMYQRLRPMAMDDARCGGCGGKIGADTLAAALAGLAGASRPDSALRPDIPLGLAAAEDAAVTLPPPGLALVQSVDQFRAFIDDPYLFGAIAAAHALSDLHAMGARPWTALAIAALPPGPKAGADLAAMMRGASDTLARDGCVLTGGHTAEAAETALGFAVTGVVALDAVWRKSGLRVGDALILTKPLGTGLILAAHMRGQARAAWLQAALASMRRTNAAAAAILRDHGVTAATDVTGFGLAGHLGEMLRASGVGATVARASLPVLPGAATLAAAGIESTLAPDNAAASGITDALLIDPQTSGGLLAAIAPGHADACVAALRAAGDDAACIGRVVAGAPVIALA